MASASERIETPLRILYVCTANVCRSPFMELLSRHRTGDDTALAFSSAGTRGFDGRAMDPVMADTLRARGVDEVETFASRPFRRELLDQADLVLTAEASHRQFILDDHADAFRKVFTLGQFAQSVIDLDGDLGGAELIAAVAQQRASTADIPDPIGRGPEVAEQCAVTIADYLDVVLPALIGDRTPRA